MKLLTRVLAVLGAFAVVILVTSASWLFLYSGDIPQMRELRGFAPSNQTTAIDSCHEGIRTVVPYSDLGDYVLFATRAAEGDERNISTQLARGMFCTGSRMMKRQLLEYKASVQLRSKMSSEQLMTTYLNRANFGDGVIGIYDASQYYFRKAPRELDIGQAAMLIGLVKSPTKYSPVKHPDRAKLRRDEVIQSMVEMHFINAEAGRLAADRELQLVRQ